MDENNVIPFTEWDGNTCNIIADHINISQNLQKLFILCIRWMISILYTIHNLYRKCIIIYHINISQNLQNLFILFKKCHFKFINNMLSFQLMITVLTEAPLSTQFLAARIKQDSASCTLPTEIPALSNSYNLIKSSLIKLYSKFII